LSFYLSGIVVKFRRPPIDPCTLMVTRQYNPRYNIFIFTMINNNIIHIYIYIKRASKGLQLIHAWNLDVRWWQDNKSIWEYENIVYSMDLSCRILYQGRLFTITKNIKKKLRWNRVFWIVIYNLFYYIFYKIIIILNKYSNFNFISVNIFII